MGRHDQVRQLQTPSLPSRDHRHPVWLYFRFPLSLRLVEEMLLERGILVSYETVRRSKQQLPDLFTRLVLNRVTVMS